MTELRAFRALRYDPKRVELSRVLVPPYDVIAAEERAALWARDPHCAIRLELTRSVEEEADTDYAEVGRTLAAWRREGVLLRDPVPALYALRQRFAAPDGTPRTRAAFFGLLRLEDYARRVVRPHERTLSGPKADRLKLLRATRANLSGILLLYEDRESALAPLLAEALETDPLASAEDEAGTRHELARIAGPASIERVRAFLAGRPVVIADGHHRYETALAYRDEQGAASDPEAPSAWVLACFANAFDPGTLLLPIHRLVLAGTAPDENRFRGRLPGWRLEAVALPSPEALPALLAGHLAPLRERHAFALDDASGRLFVFSRPRETPDELDVRVLHREVIEGVFGLDEAAVREGAIAYPKSALQTARELRAGRGCAALYLNPLTPEDVFRVTAAGEVLPQKSTFFYPKLPTGLVLRSLEEP